MARRRKINKTRKAQKPNTGNIIFGMLIIAIIVGTMLFLFFQTEGGTSAATKLFGSAFAPIQEGATRATMAIRNAITGVGRYREMSYQNQEYLRKIQELELELSMLEEAAIENDRLNRLLQSNGDVIMKEYDPVFATVIGRDPGVWFDMFEINRGTSSGIDVDMAVVNGDGLVGRVVDVGLNYAKVQTITDSRSSVACIIERTRDNGIMRGSSDPSATRRECTMHYLQAGHDVMPDDRVVTSGTDKLYPKGLTVGIVASVSRDASIADQSITVVPSVDFLHIEEVMVLRSKVESDDDVLPPLPTASPKPMPTMKPSQTSAADADTLDNQDENSAWSRPTPIANSQDNVPHNVPRTKATVSPEFPVPEDEWAELP